MKKHITALLIYIVIRFFFVSYLDRYLPGGSYTFEILFVLHGLYLFKNKFKISFEFERPEIAQFLLSYGLGFGTFKLGSAMGIQAPFNIDGPMGVIMLAMLGPILEELIFRFTLFHHLENILKNEKASVISIAALFSFSHFFTFFFVGDQGILNFIYYQTVYTLLIGLWWGFTYIKTERIDLPIYFHILYNSGFYFAMVS